MRSGRKTGGRSFRRRFRRPVVERLEDRRLLAYGATEFPDGSLEVVLDDALDQFGFQPTVFQAYDGTPENGMDDALGAFSIFDTGASVVTFGANDQLLFSMVGFNGVPVGVPCGAIAEGVGGLSLVGHISQPGTVLVDGLHVSTLSFDEDGFPVFEMGFHDPLASTVSNPLSGDAALLGGAELSALDGEYQGHYVAFATGQLRGQVRQVGAYLGASRRFEFSAPFSAEPSAGDSFLIVAPEAPFVASSGQGQVSDSTPAAQQFNAGSGLSAQDNYYEGHYVQFTSGALTGRIERISEYVGATRAIYLAEPLPAAPANGDAFEIVQINTTPAAIVDGIQAFLGAYEGAPPDGCPAPASAALPTIAGTPMLKPSASQPEGLAVNIRPSGALMDFSDFAGMEGLIIPVPDVRFQEPGLGIPEDPMCLVSGVEGTRSVCTPPVRLSLDFAGAEVDEAGRLSEGYNPVQSHVTVRHNELELTDQVFLYDTGAQLSIISVEQAELLGLDLLAPEDTVSVQGAGGVINDLPGYRIESISLPLEGGKTLTFKNVWVYVIDAAPGMDGIMGMNLFNSASAMLYDPHRAGGPVLELSFFTEQLYALPFADVEEIEPNGERELANPLQPGQFGYGALAGGDVDFWGTPGGSPGDLVFAYADPGDGAASGARIEVLGGDGSLLGADAGDGPAGGAVVAGAEVPAGLAGSIYYRVEAAPGGQINRYELYTAIVDPLDAADEGEVSGGSNNTLATATPVTQTMMSGQLGLDDVDNYAFVATEGSRIVVMIDNDPDRDGQSTPVGLTLLGPDGGEVVSQTVPAADGNAGAVRTVAAESGLFYVRVQAASAGSDDDYRFVVLVLDGGTELLAADLIQTAEQKQADAEAAVASAEQNYNDAWVTYTACGGDPVCELDALVAISEAEGPYLEAMVELITVTEYTTYGQAFAGSISSGIMPQMDITEPSLVQSLTPTPSGFAVQFSEPIDATGLNLFDSSSGTWGPADVQLIGELSGQVPGTLIVSSTQIEFVASGGLLPADNYTVTLRSAADGFVDPFGRELDGDGDGTAGGDYAGAFTVQAVAPDEVVLSVPDFVRGFGQAVNLPHVGDAGFPVMLSTGQDVSSVDFELTYDPALLTITGFATSIPGVSAAYHVLEPGRARFTLSSAMEFSATAGVLELGRITAVVPDTAPYGGKHVLDLTNVEVYDNDPSLPQPRPWRADDGVHVAVYPGDANASGTYSGADVTLLQRVVVGAASGFASYPLADPALLMDLNQSGGVTGADAALLQRAVVGIPVATIPALPSGLPLPEAPLGPDPRVYIVRDATAAPGQTVTVPVMVDVTDPVGITISSVDLVIGYDAEKLAVGNVRIGDMLAAAGFGSPVLNFSEPGILRLTISTAGSTPLLPQDTAGSLILIDFTVDAEAEPGVSVLNLRANFNDGLSVTSTALADVDANELLLDPAPTNESGDVLDGLLTISDTSGAFWHNDGNPNDVNDDGVISALDVLILINYINTRSTASLPTVPASPPPFYDVNADDLCTAMDVLLVINHINGQAVVDAEGEAGSTEPEGAKQAGGEDLRPQATSLEVEADLALGDLDELDDLSGLFSELAADVARQKRARWIA